MLTRSLNAKDGNQKPQLYKQLLMAQEHSPSREKRRYVSQPVALRGHVTVAVPSPPPAAQDSHVTNVQPYPLYLAAGGGGGGRGAAPGRPAGGRLFRIRFACVLMSQQIPSPLGWPQPESPRHVDVTTRGCPYQPGERQRCRGEPGMGRGRAVATAGILPSLWGGGSKRDPVGDTAQAGASGPMQPLTQAPGPGSGSESTCCWRGCPGPARGSRGAVLHGSRCRALNSAILQRQVGHQG